MTDLETRLRSGLAAQADVVEAHFDGADVRRRAAARRSLPAPASLAAGIVVATAVAIALVVLALAPPQRHRIIQPGGSIGTVTPHRTAHRSTAGPATPPTPRSISTGIAIETTPTGGLQPASTLPGTRPAVPAGSAPIRSTAPVGLPAIPTRP